MLWMGMDAAGRSEGLLPSLLPCPAPLLPSSGARECKALALSKDRGSNSMKSAGSNIPLGARMGYGASREFPTEGWRARPGMENTARAGKQGQGMENKGREWKPRARKWETRPGNALFCQAYPSGSLQHPPCMESCFWDGSRGTGWS